MSPSTNEEWKATIAEIAGALDAAKPTIALPADELTVSSLAKTIDHTLLKTDASEAQITEICEEAVKYDFAAVCVRVNFVAHALGQLTIAGKNDSIKIACVIGFHEGTQSTQSKVEESQRAIEAGATELDVVLNRSQLQRGHYTAIYEELCAIRAVSPPKIVLKLILETSQLDESEIVAAGVVAGYAGFDFIKTSTGFCGRGASVADVGLMARVAEVVGGKLGRERMKVKASGGIRTLGDAKKMLDAGAERIGASAGVAIVKELLGEGKGGEGNGY